MLRHPAPTLSSDALRELYWREEIPKAMYWLESEGHEHDFDADELAGVFPPAPAFDAAYLDELVGTGLVRRTADRRYALTDDGWAHGARMFAGEFDEFAQAEPASLCARGCLIDW